MTIGLKLVAQLRPSCNRTLPSLEQGFHIPVYEGKQNEREYMLSPKGQKRLLKNAKIFAKWGFLTLTLTLTSTLTSILTSTSTCHRRYDNWCKRHDPLKRNAVSQEVDELFLMR